MNTKNEIRKEIKNIRKNMSKTEVETKSQLITQKLINILKKTNNQIYFIYNSYNNEVKTTEIIDYLLTNKKNVYLPKISEEDMSTIPYTTSTKLEQNFYNILEPIGKEADINNFICVMPLVAADLKGHRIGQGKGYYDKYLKNKNCLKIGICYDYQIIEEIPYEEHDITLDIIISEKRTIKLNKKSRN